MITTSGDEDITNSNEQDSAINLTNLYEQNSEENTNRTIIVNSNSSPNMTEAKAISLAATGPFDYDEESRTTASQRWPIWIRDFDVFLDASAIDHPPQQKAILLHVMGSAAREIYHAKAEANDDFKEVKKKLLEHFNPLKQTDFNKFKFNSMVRDDNESVDDFASRLRAQAIACFDTAEVDKEIRRRLPYYLDDFRFIKTVSIL
jgi:hypothetical protein